MREGVNLGDEASARLCALSITLSLAAFFGLIAASMRAYPGGNWLDPSAPGHHFWANYLCDLTQPVSLSGVSNPLGALFAQLSMLCFAVALAAFFWLVPRHFALTDRRARSFVRGLGECAVLGYLAVPFTPSQLFGAVHAWLALFAGTLGLSAGLGAVVGLLRSHRAARALGVLGALSLVAGGLHAALFVRYLHSTEPAPLIVPATQKVAAMLLSSWLLGVAWLTLNRPRESGR